MVLSIGCDTKSDADLLVLGKLTPEKKAELDTLHLRKIDMADEVLILNVGGYIGESTSRELAYARKNGKRVRFLEEDEEYKPKPVPPWGEGAEKLMWGDPDKVNPLCACLGVHPHGPECTESPACRFIGFRDIHTCHACGKWPCGCGK